MKIYHMSGAGNDFAVMDARGLQVDFSALAIKLCEKYGTDGFMALGTSKIADFQLHFYNPDGSRGEMCGNGARCICKFARELGIGDKKFTIQTDAGLVYGWYLKEDRYRVQLNVPGLVDLQRKDDTAYVELGNPGIPHSVTWVPGLCYNQKEQLRPMAKSLRFDPAFPKGINVNFYDWVDDTTVKILTYERGVEDYTLACGTGSGSVAVVLWLTGKLPGGVLTLVNPGGTLTVMVNGKNGTVEALLLEGPAELLNVYEEMFWESSLN